MTITNEIMNCELNYILDEHNEPWFSGKSVASALGYTDTEQAIRKNIDIDDKNKLGEIRPVCETPLNHNQKNSIYINESGLYSLIMSSKLPTAKAFKKWVTKEVLPTIRKTGSYSIVQPPVQPVLTDIEERKLKVLEKNARVAELQILNQMMGCDNAKLKQSAVDELINILQPQQRLLTCENTWSRDIVTLCKDEFNMRIDFTTASKLGKHIKDKYVEKYGKVPEKYAKFVNGNTRMVNAYLSKDENLLITWIKSFYGL